PLDKPFVDVVTAEVRVAVGRLYFDHAFADLENRDVESAAAEVKHRDGFVFLLVETVGERCRRWLVDDTHHFETSDLAGVFGSLTLGVVEVSGNGDNRFVDLLAEIIFGRLLHLLQNDGRNLWWAPFLAACRDAHVAVAGALNFIGNLFNLFRNLVIATSHKSLD